MVLPLQMSAGCFFWLPISISTNQGEWFYLSVTLNNISYLFSRTSTQLSSVIRLKRTNYETVDPQPCPLLLSKPSYHPPRLTMKIPKKSAKDNPFSLRCEGDSTVSDLLFISKHLYMLFTDLFLGYAVDGIDKGRRESLTGKQQVVRILYYNTFPYTNSAWLVKGSIMRYALGLLPVLESSAHWRSCARRPK